MNKEELIEIIRKENVKYIKLQFCDILGTTKNLVVPASRINSILDNEQMIDGSSILGFTSIEKSDMFLKPDLNSFLIIPLDKTSEGNTLRLVCDILDENKIAYKKDPRYILKKNLALMTSLGYKNFYVGFEPEFYLFKLDEQKKPILKFYDNATYCDTYPIDRCEKCRKEIIAELEKMNFKIISSHHETGPGQNEITCKFQNALDAADNLEIFKYVVKKVAEKNDLYASFMPKPFKNIAGNGMHTNCSLFDFNDNNVFYDDKSPNCLSDVCKKWIAGILTYAKEMSLILNPTVNSYKRLVKGYEAPVYICYSENNRSAMIRIPAIKNEFTRTELRNVDSLANPYLLLAVILTAGLEGIKNNFENKISVNENLFTFDKFIIDELELSLLPTSLKEAIYYFKNSKLMKECLGEELFYNIIKIKELEWASYSLLIHEEEIKKYL